MKSIFRLFALLSFGFLMLHASDAYAEVTCPAKPAGPVNIVWSSNQIKYDFTKSQAQMDRMKSDTQSPYGRGTRTHVGGLMMGGISIRSQAQVMTLTYPRTREICQWIDRVDVNVVIDPTILIGREKKRGSCEHKAILEHEMKHVYVDREVVKKYIPIIKRKLEQAVLDVGIVGPKRERDLQKYQRKINDYIQNQIKVVNNAMDKERRARQQQIDTRQEYDRVSAKCK